LPGDLVYLEYCPANQIDLQDVAGWHNKKNAHPGIGIKDKGGSMFTVTTFISDEAAEDFLDDLGAELLDDSNAIKMTINGSTYDFLVNAAEDAWVLRSELIPAAAAENLWHVFPESASVLAILMETQGSALKLAMALAVEQIFREGEKQSGEAVFL
jgi:hypothetical protein